ncbi:hypothetical protein ALP26_00263 [Pseudomonas savastanoi pv. glycinea]|nr:hypothetical protein ALP26_00263 [Pseudomonas savastanoi pv. glycinea]
MASEFAQLICISQPLSLPGKPPAYSTFRFDETDEDFGSCDSIPPV